jgi:uncharacterized heparinase superfamily protein
MSRLPVRACLDTACQAGFRRIGKRLKRRLRFRLFYPFVGPFFFPLTLTNIEDAGPPNFQSAFDERAIAATDSPTQLIQIAEELTHRLFTLMNRPQVSLGNPVNWYRPSEEDRLWLENLHYGEWAVKLAHAYLLTGQAPFLDSLIHLCTDWIEHNPAGQEPGWEPFPLSRRLVAWTRAGVALWAEERGRGFWRTKLLPSLRQQANFLKANLEQDLANNHLMANYRTLAWMGLLLPSLPEAPQWQEIGVAGLEAELRRQVLPDGMHNERSISYHVMVLRDLFEIWWLARRQGGNPLPATIEAVIKNMLQFLADTQAPDGTWPMVNDSIPGYPMNPQELLLAGAVIFRKPQWAKGLANKSPAYLTWLREPMPAEEVSARNEPIPKFLFPQAGYGVLREGAQNYLFFDSGPMGPRGIAGHGHADTLSFVLFGKGRALIIDPGVFSYHEKIWRDHFRSTKAHNTVVVDGQDQCVFWGPFRVAFVPQARFTDSSTAYLEGEHDGYRRLPVPTLHRRRVQNMGGGSWEIRDSFVGEGEHSFALTLQFSEDAVGEIGGLNAAVRWPDGVNLKVICPSSPPCAVARIESGWISPDWNVKREAPRYVLHWKARAPLENRLILRVDP